MAYIARMFRGGVFGAAILGSAYRDAAAATRSAAATASACAPDRRAPSQVSGEEAPAEWREYRAAHPYHTQGIVLGRLRADRSRLVMVTEPPESLCLSDFRALSPRLSDGASPRWRMGYDGWVKDAVFDLPAMDSTETDALLVRLHRLVFGSAYKARVADAAAAGASDQRYQLDITVTAAELRSWLLVGSETFSPSGRAAGRSVRALLRDRAYGTYLSATPGFSVWVAPRRRDLATFATTTRNWVVDSDLILGAIADDSSVAIVARERTVPVEVLPPLRVETIRMLAGSGTAHLAQSYERTFPLSGRYDERNDWAPIYLSPVLIDDEYGSLLNITDQLLKSWSQHGTVRYVNFHYAEPRSYPFATSLFDLLKASSVTFNWNTKGAGYVVETDGYRIYALNRTGALPVSYFAGSDQHKTAATTRAEETGYAYFAGLSDPNLVRVVQYAALYQLFREFDMTAAHAPPREAASTLAMRPQMITALRDLAETPDSNITQIPNPDIVTRVLAARDVIRRIQRIGGDAGLSALADRIIEPNGPPSYGRESSSTVATLIDRTAPELRVAIRYATWRTLRDSARRAFAGAASRPTTGWIRTASIVESNASGNLVGGHNLDAAVTRVRVSSAVKKGDVRVIREGNELVVLTNPADVDRVSANVRSVSSTLDGENVPASMRRLMSNLEAHPVRSRVAVIPVVNRQPAFAGATRFGSRSIGFEPSPVNPRVGDQVAATFLATRQRGYMVIRQTDAGFTLDVGNGERTFVAPNIMSALDAVVHESRTSARPEVARQLHLVGFSERDAGAFLRNVESELRSESPRGRAPRLAGVVRDAEADINGVKMLATEHDFTRATVSEVREVVVPLDGEMKTAYEVDLHVPSRVVGERVPLHMKILIFFRENVAQPLKEAIQASFDRIIARLGGGTSIDAAVAELRAELLTHTAVSFVKFEAGGLRVVDARGTGAEKAVGHH